MLQLFWEVGCTDPALDCLGASRVQSPENHVVSSWHATADHPNIAHLPQMDSQDSQDVSPYWTYWII